MHARLVGEVAWFGARAMTLSARVSTGIVLRAEMRALIKKRQGHEINHLQVSRFFSAILLFLDLELANFVLGRFSPTLQRSAPSLSADTLWTH